MEETEQVNENEQVDENFRAELNVNIEEGAEHIDALVYESGVVCETKYRTARKLILFNADRARAIKVRMRCREYRQFIPGFTETFEEFRIGPAQRATVAKCPVPYIELQRVGYAVTYELISITNV